MASKSTMMVNSEISQPVMREIWDSLRSSSKVMCHQRWEPYIQKAALWRSKISEARPIRLLPLLSTSHSLVRVRVWEVLHNQPVAQSISMRQEASLLSMRASPRPQFNSDSTMASVPPLKSTWRTRCLTCTPMSSLLPQSKVATNSYPASLLSQSLTLMPRSNRLGSPEVPSPRNLFEEFTSAMYV